MKISRFSLSRAVKCDFLTPPIVKALNLERLPYSKVDWSRFILVHFSFILFILVKFHISRNCCQILNFFTHQLGNWNRSVIQENNQKTFNLSPVLYEFCCPISHWKNRSKRANVCVLAFHIFQMWCLCKVQSFPCPESLWLLPPSVFRKFLFDI